MLTSRSKATMKLLRKNGIAIALLYGLILPYNFLQISLLKAQSKKISGDLKVTGNGAFCGQLSTQKGLDVTGSINQKHTVFPLTAEDIKRRSHNGPDAETYDVIIVGAGTGGSLLAYALAQRYPQNKILVLETGQDDVRSTIGTSSIPNPNDPQDSWGQLLRSNASTFGEGCAQWQEIIESDIDDAFFRVPIQVARGATLGGTSAINALIFNRGTKPGTYDRWEEATHDPAFGFTSMAEAYKKIENRSQSTQIFGKVERFWYPGAPEAYQSLNNLMGTEGRLCVTSNYLEGWDVKAIKEILKDTILPGRSAPLAINQADVSENNPEECQYVSPFSQYSQADPDFLSFSPYPENTPGYTYTPPANPDNKKSGNFAGPNPSSPKATFARCYAAPAYLYPILDNTIQHRVTIKQRTYVTRLLFDEKNEHEVIGVEYVEGPNGEGWHVAEINRAINRDIAPYKGTASGTPTVIEARNKCSFNAAVENQQHVETKQAYAKADVWLCAGAIDSPAIMQRSGIGPRNVLESLRYLPVACRVDLPGVGQATQDTLDISLTVYQETDYSTGGVPFPGALPATFYSSAFSFADPDLTSIYSPAATASISGTPIQSISNYRFKSNPSLTYADTDMVVWPNIYFGLAGNALYADIQRYATGAPLNADFAKVKPVYDRAQWGYYPPEASGQYMHQTSFLFEYWDLASQGEVVINSGNVFERPSYAPNMASNERDLEALANIMNHTFFPITRQLGSKRYGPRGIATYKGQVQEATANTITLSYQLGAVKPILGNIDQATYNQPHTLDGYVVTILSGVGQAQHNTIIAWSGAPAYEATLAQPWAIIPNNTSTYALNPAGATPVDTVTFSDDNHRNFVRFAHPSGDILFSPVITNSLENNPFRTTAGSTRVHVHQPQHTLSEGDMIKISGVTTPVNGISPEYFNDYHIVYNPTDEGYDIILFWNVTPTGGPFSNPTPNPAAQAFAGIGGGCGVKVHTLRFDEAKFRTWVQEHYFSGWHPCCSNRMGKADDLGAVVDTRARVYNTKGLRVSDASMFPVKPNANTQAPTYGITQKIFDLVSVEEYDTLLKCARRT